jgi:hypothetical protein
MRGIAKRREDCRAIGSSQAEVGFCCPFLCTALLNISPSYTSHSILFDTIQSNADTLAEQIPAPYRDLPMSLESMDPKAYDEGPDPAAILQSQQQEMATQDTHLDALSASIGRQHHLSLQMSDELETHAELLEEMDTAVDSTAARLGRASRRLDKVSKSLKEHGEISSRSLFTLFIDRHTSTASTWTILMLIVILVLLIAIFK